MEPNLASDLVTRWLQGYWVLLAGLTIAAVAVAAHHQSRDAEILLPAGFSYTGDPGDIDAGGNGPTVVAFVSLTCGHCARWEADVLPDLARRGPSKAHVILREMPLDAAAFEAAVFVHCLPPMLRLQAHAGLMASQSRWIDAAVTAIGTASGVPIGEGLKAEACMQTKGPREAVARSAQAAVEFFGVHGTPAFLIGRRVTTGSRPLAELLRVTAARN